MRRRRPVPPLLALTLLLLVGCQSGEGPDAGQGASQATEIRQAADLEDTEATLALAAPEATLLRGLSLKQSVTDPSCDRRAEKDPTPPIHVITVQDGELRVVPHPLVQNPGPLGVIGWISPTHDWRVTYTDGSPLPKEVYEGTRGTRVLDMVRVDAACRAYAYQIEAWSDGDTLTKTLPAVVDTVNGDEIEPW